MGARTIAAAVITPVFRNLIRKVFLLTGLLLNDALLDNVCVFECQVVRQGLPTEVPRSGAQAGCSRWLDPGGQPIGSP